MAYSPFNFSASDYTDAQLLAAKKTQTLARGLVTVLNIDHLMMGLGGDDSWTPRTHPEYLITGQEYSFSFRMRPFDANTSIESITQTALPEVTTQSQAATELGAPASIIKDAPTGDLDAQEAAIQKAEAKKYVKKKPTYKKKKAPVKKKKR